MSCQPCRVTSGQMKWVLMSSDVGLTCTRKDGTVPHTVLHKPYTQDNAWFYTDSALQTSSSYMQTLHRGQHIVPHWPYTMHPHTVLHCRLYSSAHTLHCGSRNHDINNHTGLCDVSVFTYCTFNFSGSYRFINFAKAAVNYFLYYWFPIPQGSATSIFIFRSTWAWSASYHPRTRR